MGCSTNTLVFLAAFNTFSIRYAADMFTATCMLANIISTEKARFAPSATRSGMTVPSECLLLTSSFEHLLLRILTPQPDPQAPVAILSQSRSEYIPRK